MPTDAPGGESGNERDQRHLSELLQELRIALPGVQVLFGFLLTVPFTARFATLTAFQKAVFFVTMVTSALTIAFFVAPTVNHRLLFGKHDKAYIVTVANRLTITGVGLLALSMCGALLFVTDVVFDGSTAAITTAVAFLVFAVLWFVAPMVRRARLADEHPPAGDDPS